MLSVAVKLGSIPIIDILLENGVSTPEQGLYKATKLGNINLVEYFITLDLESREDGWEDAGTGGQRRWLNSSWILETSKSSVC